MNIQFENIKARKSKTGGYVVAYTVNQNARSIQLAESPNKVDIYLRNMYGITSHVTTVKKDSSISDVKAAINGIMFLMLDKSIDGEIDNYDLAIDLEPDFSKIGTLRKTDYFRYQAVLKALQSIIQVVREAEELSELEDAIQSL